MYNVCYCHRIAGYSVSWMGERTVLHVKGCHGCIVLILFMVVITNDIILM